MLYLTSGKLLKLPIARKNKHYKSEHWMPCFVTIPTKEDLEMLLKNTLQTKGDSYHHQREDKK